MADSHSSFETARKALELLPTRPQEEWPDLLFLAIAEGTRAECGCHSESDGTICATDAQLFWTDLRNRLKELLA